MVDQRILAQRLGLNNPKNSTNLGIQGVQRPVADIPVLYLAQAPKLEAFQKKNQDSGHLETLRRTADDPQMNLYFSLLFDQIGLIQQILNRTMSSIENRINYERRVAHLLCAAINSQLELEKATENLIKNVYRDLKRMKASGCSSEDWIAMFEKSQELVDTFRLLIVDESPLSTIEERRVVVKVENEFMSGGKPEEDIEEYLEVLLKEIHPNLDYIRAASSLDKQELHDVFGLAKQMAEPHKFAFDEETKKATNEEKKDNRVKRNKKKNRKERNRKYERREGGFKSLDEELRDHKTVSSHSVL
ncbi:hypothetical protein BHYA_0190g00170 [Botrytis hyacinthi]|uniref:Uncharacterized protein n=1 Tax=Botrytis hyacinthi TaxID=278943 RepID=A0A4Z1GHJ8_9HELO|nr:hypothetical protein BHYA_0190g00170 [Botrytis hyacinthi]